MTIEPIKAKATQLVFKSVSSLCKNYEHIRELHSPLRTIRGLLELTQKVVLVAFIVIPLALIVYVIRSLIHRVRPVSHNNASQILPGPETPMGPGAPPEIQRDVTRLGEAFDQLLKNLKELHREKGTAFENAIARFFSDYETYEKNADFQNLFSTVDGYRKAIQQLKAMERGLYIIPSRIQDDGIIPQPSDGNCLFHSLVEGLAYVDISFGPMGMDKNELAHQLRTEIVEWMQRTVNEDETLQVLINQAIEDFIEMRNGQMKSERATAEVYLQEPENEERGKEIIGEIEKIEKEIQEFQGLLSESNHGRRYSCYFEKIGHPGFFGSKAEIYAFSRKYPEVRIDVRHRLKDCFLEGFDFSYNKSKSKIITLAYITNEIHFNLLAPKASLA